MTNAITLDSKQRQFLRGLAHDLDPVVQIGKHGLTEGVIGAIDEALTRHELIKIRVGTECPEDRSELGERIAPATKATVVGEVGRILMVYRRHPSAPVISLPGLPAPKKKESTGAKRPRRKTGARRTQGAEQPESENRPARRGANRHTSTEDAREPGERQAAPSRPKSAPAARPFGRPAGKPEKRRAPLRRT